MFGLFVVACILLPDLYLELRFSAFFKKHRWIKWLRRMVPLFFLLSTLRLYLHVGEAQNIKLAVGFMWFIWAWCLFYIPKILYMFTTIWEYLYTRITRKSTPWFHRLGLLWACYAVYFFLNGAFWGRFDQQVQRITLTSDKLPQAFDGTKIIHISDIHIGNLDEEHRILQNLLDQVNEENADYIFQTGDLVNNRADEINAENMRFFQQMRAKKGKYAVLGNHDYGDYTRWKTPAEKVANLQKLIHLEEEGMGFVMLNNRSVVLKNGGDSIALIGVENWGEPPFPRYGDLPKALEDVATVPFKILLTHNPIHWDREVKQHTDITLSLAGHTHAMQMEFKLLGYSFSPAQFRYPKWGGLYNEGEQYLYVNRGIGYVLYPLRYQTGPEVTVIELRRPIN